jgi:hypothetical protein
MGLWLARKLFDSVDLLRRENGFTVRLSTALRPAAPGLLTPPGGGALTGEMPHC